MNKHNEPRGSCSLYATMMSFSRRSLSPLARGWVMATVVLLTFLLAPPGVVVAEQQQDASAATLWQRAQTYWTAKELRDLVGVYQLEAASLPGGWLKPDAVAAGWPSRNVQLKGVRIEGDRGFVSVVMETKIGIAPFKPREFDDKWVLVDGKWLHDTYNPRLSKWYHEIPKQ